jgi:hypothetical protein
MHYLLPIFPAFSLLVARTLPATGYSRSVFAPVALMVMATGAVLFFLPYYAQQLGFPAWMSKMEAWRGIAVMTVGAVLLLFRCADRLAEVWKMTLFSAFALTLIIYLAVMQNSGLAFDIRPMGQRLKALQEAGVPLAHNGDYAGQYQFVGRMVDEPEAVSRVEIAAWFKAHPDGKVIVYFWKRRTLEGFEPYYQQPYLDDIVAILGRESWPVPTPRAP